MYDNALILGIAFILDLLLGDPTYRLHPVRCIGTTVQLLEKFLRRMHLNGIAGGGLLVMLTLTIVCSITLGLHIMIRHLDVWAAFVLHIYLVTSCMALRDLIAHANPVAQALQANDLTCARSTVQRIIGRDVMYLDEAGVARATVETVAENFVDSLLSPLFWYVVGALVLSNTASNLGALMAIVGYRTVNTLDAMVGHRNKRYITFGRAAARLDDILNFIPARLSILILPFSAALCRQNGLNAFKTALNDRNKHVSPNAGHPESCLAGALNIRLGGPAVYPYNTVEKPWLGQGDINVTAAHIKICCRIVFVAGCISAALAVLTLIGIAAIM
jgi:adenosylcobinamide-phosphate synthase